MKNVNLMLSYISDQLPYGSCIKSPVARQAQPPDILRHEISERAVAPGRAQVRLVSPARQDVNKVNSHPLSAAGVQSVR